jgi:hypothetical protein
MNQISRIRSAGGGAVLMVAAALGGAAGGCGEPFKDPAVEIFRADVASLKSRVAALEAQGGAATRDTPAARQGGAEWAASIDGNVLVRVWSDAAEYPAGTTSIGFGTDLRNARNRPATLPGPGLTTANLHLVGPGGKVVRVVGVTGPASAQVTIDPATSSPWSGRVAVEPLTPGEYRATYTYTSGSTTTGDVPASTAFRVK